jgi:hypothetical protein
VVEQTFTEYSKELCCLLSRIEVTALPGERMSLEDGMERAISTILSKKAEGQKIIVIDNGWSAVKDHMDTSVHN